MRRAVLYARCSTEEESQKEALVSQVAEAKECITHQGWLLVDEYVESRSGTTTKGRTEYNRLFDDLRLDKFDIIVIKSQDRLMRNVKDWYLFVERLTREQKKLYMYIERKFYTADDALITGIRAILAEDYSRELSKKINNAHQNRQKNNGNVILTNNAYGFRKLKDKSVVLDEEEAAIKRRMYELCAAGFGTRTISTVLKNDGILNRKGKPFTSTSILRIIHNPINKGTVVMNRKHFDFESKMTIRVPEEGQYIYENKVPATVSEELWELANQKIAERVSEKNIANSKDRIGKNKGKSQMSGKLFCGMCGEPYYRRTRRQYKDKSMVYFWACKTYLDVGRNEGGADRPQLRRVQLEETEGCDNINLDEETLYQLLQKVAEENYVTDKEKIVCDMLKMLKTVLQEENVPLDIEIQHQKKEKIKKQMDTLVNKLLEGVISDNIYQVKQKELELQLQQIKDKIKKLEQKNVKGQLLSERIERIESAMRESNVVEKATVTGMLDEVEKILIYPEYLEIYFCYSKILGIDDVTVIDDEAENVMRIEFGNAFNYLKKKREERNVVIDMMKENPYTTAKMIAERLGISLSGANYKIKALKRDGRIYFDGKGGHGKWVILEDGKL